MYVGEPGDEWEAELVDGYNICKAEIYNTCDQNRLLLVEKD